MKGEIMTDPFLREYGKLNWMTWKYTAGNLSSLKSVCRPSLQNMVFI